MTNLLEYTFLRTEADNKITLFIQANPTWLEQECDITLTPAKQLSIKLENGETLISNTLPIILHHHLTTQTTKVILSDKEMNFLGTFNLDPLEDPSLSTTNTPRFKY